MIGCNFEEIFTRMSHTCIVSQSMGNIHSANNSLTNLEMQSAKSDVNFQKWNQSLTAQLQELRDKIAKARHVAEGVSLQFLISPGELNMTYIMFLRFAFLWNREIQNVFVHTYRPPSA